jgi:hypothetical protein
MPNRKKPPFFRCLRFRLFGSVGGYRSDINPDFRELVE